MTEQTTRTDLIRFSTFCYSSMNDRQMIFVSNFLLSMLCTNPSIWIPRLGSYKNEVSPWSTLRKHWGSSCNFFGFGRRWRARLSDTILVQSSTVNMQTPDDYWESVRLWEATGLTDVRWCSAGVILLLMPRMTSINVASTWTCMSVDVVCVPVSYQRQQSLRNQPSLRRQEWVCNYTLCNYASCNYVRKTYGENLYRDKPYIVILLIVVSLFYIYLLVLQI